MKDFVYLLTICSLLGTSIYCKFLFLFFFGLLLNYIIVSSIPPLDYLSFSSVIILLGVTQ